MRIGHSHAPAPERSLAAPRAWANMASLSADGLSVARPFTPLSWRGLSMTKASGRPEIPEPGSPRRLDRFASRWQRQPRGVDHVIRQSHRGRVDVRHQ